MVERPPGCGPNGTVVASLASCVAFSARRHLLRPDLPFDGLAVSATYDMADKPPRVGCVDVRIVLAEGSAAA
jgi:putative redox protein